MLKVHPSNYRVTGFTDHRRASAELAALGPPVVVRHRLGAARRRLPVAGRRPAGVAGRRAGRPPDAGRRRRPRDVQRRQAPRRAPGGHHRRASRPRRRLRRPSPGPGAAARRPGARRAAGRRARLPAPRRRRHPVLADGVGAGRTTWRRGPTALGRRRRSWRCESLPGAGSLPGVAIPSVGVAVDGDRTAALRGRRPAGHRPRAATGRTICDLRTVDARRRRPRRPRPSLTGVARARRRHRRPRRPRQVVARAGAHRHRPRPLRRGEAPRPDDRPRLRLDHAALGRRHLLRRRARPRPVPQEHAGRRGRPSTPASSSSRPPRGGSRSPRSTCASSSCSASRHGVVALTKVDLVDDELAELATLDVADHVAGTFLEGAPIVAVAAPAGVGLDELRAALDGLVATTPAAADRGRPRLWVDRAFAAEGAGTVVTGTLTGGALAVGDGVVVGPGGAAGARAGHPDASAGPSSASGPGNRVALNLSGVEHDAGHAGRRGRGAGPLASVTPSFDAVARGCSAALDHDVSRRGAYLAYVGSGEHPARLRVLGAERIAPRRPTASCASASPRAAAAAARRPLRAARERPGRDRRRRRGARRRAGPARVAGPARPLGGPGGRRAGLGRRRRARACSPASAGEPDLGRWVAAPGALDALVAALGRAGRRRGRRSGWTSPRSTSAARLALALVAGRGRRRRAGPAGRPRRPAGRPPVPRRPRGGRRAPRPRPTASTAAELRELVRRGLVVERDGIWFAPSAVDRRRPRRRRGCWRAPAAREGIHRGAFRDAHGHDPQARHAAAGRARPAGRHPAPGRSAHRRPAAAA